MIIAFSFHRIMVNVLLIMINILFHRKLQYRVKTPSRHNIASIAYFKRSVSFRFVYNFKFFYILKHLKVKLTEENQASVELYPDVLSKLDSDQGYPTVYGNIGEEYRLPQITIGAKEKWQLYLGYLSIIIWVRYTHARMRT